MRYVSLDLARISILLGCALGAAGCALGPPDTQQLRITLPSVADSSTGGSGSGARDLSSNLFSISNANGSLQTAPTALSSFGCFGVNVTGSGIAANSTMTAQCPSDGISPYMGSFGGLASVNSGYLDITVPSGPARTIQLFAATLENGATTCPDINTVIGTQGNNNLGQPYELGRVTTDIFADTSVSIQAAFDPTQPKVLFCSNNNNNNNSNGGGNPTQLVVVGPNSPGLIGQSMCTPYTIQSQDSSGRPADMPSSVSGITVALSSTDANTQLYTSNASCNGSTGPTGISGTLAIGPNQNQVQFFAKTAAPPTTPITFSAYTTATGWTLPALNVVAVADHLSPSPTPAPYSSAAGSCYAVTVPVQSSGGTTVMTSSGGYTFSLGLQAYSTSASLTPPSIKFYSTATHCSAGTSDLTLTGGVFTFSQTIFSPSMPENATFYISDSVQEAVNVSVVDQNGAVASGGFSLTFGP